MELDLPLGKLRQAPTVRQGKRMASPLFALSGEVPFARSDIGKNTICISKKCERKVFLVVYGVL